LLQDYSTTKTYTTITPTEPTSITYYVRVKDANNAVSDSCKSVTVTWKNVAPTANNIS
jgi:hypothetical protein